MENSKLKIKIGNHEFEAEGSQEHVQQQFERFCKLIEKSIETLPLEKTITTEKPNTQQNTDEIKSNGFSKTLPLEKIIKFDKDKGLISLIVLPTSGETRDADAVLLLLLGYNYYKNETEILVTVLNEALEQSGIYSKDRINKTISPYIEQHLILKSGSRKGSKCKLSNQGMRKAEEIAWELIKL